MTVPYGVFTEFNQTRDVVTLRGNEVTTGLWTGDTGSLSAVFTSSAQVGVSGEFFYELYNANPNTGGSDTAEAQFAVAYGHVSGSGSPPLTTLNTSTLPTEVIYSQYRNLLLGDTNSLFQFGPSTALESSEDIYVINFQRARLRQALDPGNWQLTLSGSRGLISLIDNSGLAEATTGNLTVNNSYDVMSGSITGGTVGSTYFGKVYPDYGIIVLHPKIVSQSVGFASASVNARTGTLYPFAPYTGSGITGYQYQHEGLVRSISASMAAGYPFQARSAEAITSVNYFVRVFNSEYNFTNNPTILSGSTQVPLEAFRTVPISYVTTVGLYNETNELLAVAKLSRPLEKSTDKEATIRVRLDY